jgi:hypothetical protein
MEFLHVFRGLTLEIEAVGRAGRDADWLEKAGDP